MSTDKRRVSTDALETLGEIITENEKRDAIHLAVEPVRAGENLKPGTPITLTDGVAYRSDREVAIGIVDPFLKKTVKQGQYFWLVVMPRQITSLRHVWTHPAFKTEEEMRENTHKSEAFSWIVNYLDGVGIDDHHKFIEDILSGEFGEYYTVYGTDVMGRINPKVFDMIEIYSGKKVPSRPRYFSCSC